MTSSTPLLSRRQQLRELRRRIVADLGPASNVQVRHQAEVALLQSFSPAELLDFAASCGARVVSRMAGDEFEFTPAPNFHTSL